MKSLILAAGYATRLYPLTRNFPKPLLDVGGVSILDRLLADLDTIPGLSGHVLITNATFAPVFEKWLETTHYRQPVTIVDDGTTDNEHRLGAVRDILFAIETLGLDEDLLVLAGDNLVNFSFAPFVDYARSKGCSCITCHHEPSLPALQKTGVLEATPDMKVLAMHEKPVDPPSNWAVPPFYLYRAADLPLIRRALDEGCGFDAPGNLAGWLCRRLDMYAWPLPGKRHDIGDLVSYEHVREGWKD